MEAQRSEQCLGPLIIQSSVSINDQEVVSISQRKGYDNTKSTIQLCDFEGEDHLQLQVQGLQLGYEPTEALVTEGNQQPQFEDQTVINVGDPETRGSVFNEPMRYEGWLSFLEDFILGPNRQNQIWRLRLLSAFCLYITTVIGIHGYPIVREAEASYQRVMLITSIGAPIIVAAISLFVSSCLASVLNRRSNWVSGLAVANVILLFGPPAIYWAHKRGTGN